MTKEPFSNSTRSDSCHSTGCQLSARRTSSSWWSPPHHTVREIAHFIISHKHRMRFAIVLSVKCTFPPPLCVRNAFFRKERELSAKSHTFSSRKTPSNLGAIKAADYETPLRDAADLVGAYGWLKNKSIYNIYRKSFTHENRDTCETKVPNAGINLGKNQIHKTLFFAQSHLIEHFYRLGGSGKWGRETSRT